MKMEMAIIPEYESAANGCVQYAEGDQSSFLNDQLTWSAVHHAMSLGSIIHVIKSEMTPSQRGDAMSREQCLAEWDAVYNGREYSTFPRHAAALHPRPNADEWANEA